MLTFKKSFCERRGEAMEPRIAKDIIELQKATFDNTFSALSMFQDQAERATKMILESSMLPVPEEGKKILDEWVHAFKKGRDEFKKAVDESYKKMEEAFNLENPGERPGERGRDRPGNMERPRSKPH
jgi:hypothetical protein